MKSCIAQIIFCVSISLISLNQVGAQDSLVLYAPDQAYQQYWLERDSVNRDWSALQYATEALLNLGYYAQADSLLQVYWPALERSPKKPSTMEVRRTAARLYSVLARYERASALFEDCVQFYRQEGRAIALSQTLVNQAEFYRSSGQFGLGKQVLLDLINRPDFEDLPAGIKATAYHRMAALVLEGDRNTDSALALSYRSLKYSESAQAISHMATSYLEIGYIFYNLNDARCLLYFNKALAIWRQLRYHHYMGNAYLNISSFFLRRAQLQKAWNYLDSAQALNEQYQIPGFSPLLLRRRAEWWYQQGDLLKAYQLRDSSADLKEAFLRREYDKDIAEAGQKFQVQLTRSQLEASEVKRKAAEEAARQERWWRFYLISGLMGLLLLISVVALSRRRIKRNNLQLQKQSELIEKQNDQLRRNVKEKEALLKEVHHRVKNNLQTMAAMMEMQKLQESTTEKVELVLDSFLKRLRAMSLVHERLYDSKELDSLDTRAFVEALVKEIRAFADSEHSAVDFSLDLDPLDLDIQKSLALGMLITELINNSLKHGFAQQRTGKVELQMHRKGQDMHFIYQDDGRGLAEQLGKEGLGSRLIRMFVRQLKGVRLEPPANLDQGYYFSFQFPIPYE